MCDEVLNYLDVIERAIKEKNQECALEAISNCREYVKKIIHN